MLESRSPPPRLDATCRELSQRAEKHTRARASGTMKGTMRAKDVLWLSLSVSTLACGGQTALPTGATTGSGAAGATVIEGDGGASGTGGATATGTGGATTTTGAGGAAATTGAGGATTTGAGGAAVPVGLTRVEGVACSADGGNEIGFKNTADAQARLVGVWVLCRGAGLTQATEQPNQAGIEFGADMSWHLMRRVNGALVRANGFQASGTYTFPQPQDLDFGSSMRVDLFFGLDFSFYEATILDSPRKMAWSPVAGTPSTSPATIYAPEPGAQN
jgi:hypothetical protein